MKTVLVVAGILSLAVGVWTGTACCSDIPPMTIAEGQYRYEARHSGTDGPPPKVEEEYPTDDTCSFVVSPNEVSLEYEGKDQHRYRVRYQVIERLLFDESSDAIVRFMGGRTLLP